MTKVERLYSTWKSKYDEFMSKVKDNAEFRIISDSFDEMRKSSIPLKAELVETLGISKKDVNELFFGVNYSGYREKYLPKIKELVKKATKSQKEINPNVSYKMPKQAGLNKMSKRV